MKQSGYISITLLLMILFTSVSWAQEESPRWEELGFRDADGDGKNDIFRDANGDGINDVSGNTYRHRFQFIDADEDGNNDLFIDADGDGINDLADTDSAGERSAAFNVIDFDGDGVNDVTGRQYQQEKMMHQRFIDEDADGIDDRTFNIKAKGRMGIGKAKDKDKFFDRDGDGINDGRGFARERRHKGQFMEGKKQGRGKDK